MTSTSPSALQQPDAALPFRLEAAAAILLGFAAIAGPLALGGTGTWPRFAVECSMTLASILCLAASARSSVTRFATVSAIAVGCLAFVQLAPLPDRLLGSLSPLAGSAWKIALADAPASWGSISVDPSATAAALRRVFVWLMTLCAVRSLASKQVPRRILTASLAVSASLILILGIAFPVDKKQRVLLGFVDLKGPLEYWRDPVAEPVQTSGWSYLDWIYVDSQRYLVELGLVGDGFGSYISSNEYAAGVYLTIPFACAAITVMASRCLPTMAQLLPAMTLFGAGIWIVGGVAHSRAGGAALLLGAIVFVWLSVRSSWLRAVVAAIAACYTAALCVFALTFWSEFTGVVHFFPADWQQRLMAMLADGRTLATKAALQMSFASPWFGTGLNTYGSLYPRFAKPDVVWYYAHNDYAQLLAEAGIFGILGLLFGCASLARTLRSYLRKPREDALTDETLSHIAAWASTAALLAHSGFDWNMHVPANALLACIVIGLAAGSGSCGAATKSVRRFPVGKTVIATLLLGTTALLARDATIASTSRDMRKALTAMRSLQRDDDLPRNTLRETTRYAIRAYAWDRSSSQLAVLIGQATLYLRDDPAEAAQWFRNAVRNAPFVRGIPEPVASQP